MLHQQVHPILSKLTDAYHEFESGSIEAAYRMLSQINVADIPEQYKNDYFLAKGRCLLSASNWVEAIQSFESISDYMARPSVLMDLIACYQSLYQRFNTLSTMYNTQAGIWGAKFDLVAMDQSLACAYQTMCVANSYRERGNYLNDLFVFRQKLLELKNEFDQFRNIILAETRLLQLQKDYPDFLFIDDNYSLLAARIFMKDKQYENALFYLKTYQKRCRQDFANPYVTDGLMVCYRALNRLQDADKANLRLFTHFLTLGSYEEASKYYERLIYNENKRNALFDVFEVFKQRNDITRLYLLFQQIVKDFSRDRDIQQEAATFFFDHGFELKGLKVLHHALKQWPADPFFNHLYRDHYQHTMRHEVWKKPMSFDRFQEWHGMFKPVQPDLMKTLNLDMPKQRRG